MAIPCITHQNYSDYNHSNFPYSKNFDLRGKGCYAFGRRRGNIQCQLCGKLGHIVIETFLSQYHLHLT